MGDQPTQQSLISRFTPPTMRGQVLGILTSTNSLALMVGPVLAGLLLNVSTSAPNLVAAAVMGIAFLVSLPIFQLAVPSSGIAVVVAAD